MTKTTTLRSRVPGNWRARFWSGGGEDDFLANRNPTPQQERELERVLLLCRHLHNTARDYLSGLAVQA